MTSRSGACRVLPLLFSIASGAAADCGPVKFQFVNDGTSELQVEHLAFDGPDRPWRLDMRERRVPGTRVYTTDKLKLRRIESGSTVIVRPVFRPVSGDGKPTGPARTGDPVRMTCEPNVTVRVSLP